MIEQLRSALAPMEQRIRLMAGRAIVRLVNDAAKAQELQLELLADEVQDGVERFQQYGITSHPHAGAEALVVFPAGLRSHGIAVVVEDRRYRLTGLQAGEVAIYDDLGNVVKLGRDAISVEAVSKLDITAPEVTVTADSATITSDAINLGAAGGQPVARIGDSVDPVTHLITSGSSKVKAA